MLTDILKTAANSLFLFFKSIKLAVVLLLFIGLTSIFSTLIPQGEPIEFYSNTYSGPIAWIILTAGLNNFFVSPLFILPALLFFINLSVCSVNRFYKRVKSGAKKRFGPDFLHLGILILISGSIISAAGRKDGLINLGPGDYVELPGNYRVYLEDFEFQQYDDGTPKDWISTVKVTRDGRTIREEFRIEVNHPLRIGKVKLYQHSYSSEIILHLIDNKGNDFVLKPGDFIETADSRAVFTGIKMEKEPKTVYFERQSNNGTISREEYLISDKIGIHTIQKIRIRNLTGLQAVIDPGYPVVIAGLILIASGLFVTYIRKTGGGKK